MGSGVLCWNNNPIFSHCTLQHHIHIWVLCVCVSVCMCKSYDMNQWRDIKLLWPIRDQLKSCDFNRSESDLANFFVCHIMHTPTQIFFSFFFPCPEFKMSVYKDVWKRPDEFCFLGCGSFHHVNGASQSNNLQLAPDTKTVLILSVLIYTRVANFVLGRQMLYSRLQNSSAGNTC